MPVSATAAFGVRLRCYILVVIRFSEVLILHQLFKLLDVYKWFQINQGYNLLAEGYCALGKDSSGVYNYRGPGERSSSVHVETPHERRAQDLFFLLLVGIPRRG